MPYSPLAPKVIVDAPLAQPSLYGLLQAAQSITDTDERWTMGYDWDPQSSIAVTVQDPANLGNTLAAALANPTTLVTTRPFMLDLSADRETWGWQAQDYPERPRRWLDQATGAAVEAQFWTGSLATGNQALAVSGCEVLNATALSPGRALGALEAEIGSWGAGGRGMIHANPELVTAWAQLQLLDIDGQRLVTRAKGTIVVSGSGYPKTGPLGATNATPAANHAWAFASGLCQVRLTPIVVVPESLNEALDRRTNSVSYLAHRYAAVNFDPTLGPTAAYVNMGT